MTNPIDVIKSDLSKAVRVDYPDGEPEFMTYNQNGFLLGVMDGMGPFPLYEPDARAVCEKYETSIINVDDIQ